MVRKKTGPKGQSFLQGALVLTLGVFLVKVIGAFYKIPLSAVLQEDGMGYFSTAYSFYNVLFSVATVGLPVAVSRMVAQSEALGRLGEIRAAKRVAIPVFFAVGLIGTAITAAAAPFYTRAVGNPGALPAMLALAPAVLFCSVASAYRGYFEGRRNMYPTMLSQVTEAAAKLLLGLSGAYMVVKTCTEEFAAHGTVLGEAFSGASAAGQRITSLAAGAAILGVTAGAALSLLFLFLYDAFSRKGETAAASDGRAAPWRQIAAALCRTAAPVALGAVSVSLAGLLDASFLQTRLMAVLRENPAPMLAMYQGSIPADNLAAPATIPNYLFGCYNMALTVFMLVPSVTQAFATSALPAVTRAASAGRAALTEAIESVLRLTCLFALPAGAGLFALAEPIARFLYGDRPGTPIVAAALCVMGAGAALAAVSMPLSGMLQAVGRADLPVILMLIGLLMKVGLNFVLAGVPEINVLAGAWSTVACYAFVAAAEFCALRRVTKVRVQAAVFLKPLLAALVCAITAHKSMPVIQSFTGGTRLDVLPAVAVGAVFYVLALLLTGMFRKKQINVLLNAEKSRKR